MLRWKVKESQSWTPQLSSGPPAQDGEIPKRSSAKKSKVKRRLFVFELSNKINCTETTDRLQILSLCTGSYVSPCFCFSVAVLWASSVGVFWEKAGLRDGGRRSCFGNIGSGGVCRHGLFLRCHSLRSHFGPSSPTPFFLKGLPDPTFHLRGCFLCGLYRPLRSHPIRKLLRSPFFFFFHVPILHLFFIASV